MKMVFKQPFTGTSGNTCICTITSHSVKGKPHVAVQAEWDNGPTQTDIKEFDRFIALAAAAGGNDSTFTSLGRFEDKASGDRAVHQFIETGEYRKTQ